MTEKVAAMIFLNGSSRSFRCTAPVPATDGDTCSANVFTQEGDIFTCNACGTKYEGS